ncbi:MAG TPA: hypothetical protein VKR21_12985 [Solirubrobacteraceae bacterium]|nr:hypothetical protein [Solirubrobacteraceae bacterium]
MSFRRPHPESSPAHEHVADPPVTGGGGELLASRERAAHAPRIRHAGRFRWVTAGLFLLAVASLAAAVLLSGNGPRVVNSGAAWSAWRPPDDGLAGAQEIADYLAPYYRATPSDQLAIVTVVNLNNPANPLQVVVPAPGSSQGLLPLPPSGTIVYNLCGVGGSDCAIGVGQPSAARLLLLRREALELALYTFKYISGTQNVVAILPPGHTLVGCTGICAKPQSKPIVKPLDLAVAFDRSELGPYLAEPLRRTLPEEIPPSVGQMPVAAEAPLVSVITAHGLFAEKTQQGQDGSTVLTLTPMPPQ